MGNEQSSGGSKGPTQIKSGDMFVLTTADGVLAPLEEKLGFRATAGGMFSSMMGSKPSDAAWRPQLCPTDKVHVQNSDNQ